MDRKAPTSEMVQEWLARRISQRLKIDPSAIDPRADFASFGIDSMEAVRIVADLEVWLGRRLDPALMWDYPNIEAIAKRLTGQEA